MALNLAPFSRWTLRKKPRRPLTSTFGAGTGEVVLVASIKAAEIESVIDQIIQGVFKGAEKQLPFEIDGDESRAGVDGLVAGHEYLSRRISSWSLVIPFGSRQDARMKQLFLQLR